MGDLPDILDIMKYRANVNAHAKLYYELIGALNKTRKQMNLLEEILTK